MDKEQYDIAIVGGGLAGLSLACLMGQAEGLSIICIDQAPAKLSANNDLRTTAISYGSRKILEEAGVWQKLEGQTSPINDIQILDGSSPLLLNFLSDEVEDKSFGWIVLNADLRAALMARLSELSNVTHRHSTKVRDYALPQDQDSISQDLVSQNINYVKCILGGEREPINSSNEIHAALVVGADGRNSFTRKWMGVKTRGWSYEQRAIICTVEHEQPHNNIAVEHFWPQGPFAILPMQDGPDGQHRSSLVFTEHGPEKDSLMRYDEQAFTLAMAARFPESYGAVKLLGERACYPLSLVHAASYIAPRMVLVADAAHGIHPIAGQGLNLGFRDVKCLADLVKQAHQQGQDVGSDALLETYQRQRRPDNMAMVAVTDGLNRLFSNNIPPVRLLRRAGLKLVSRLGPAKQFFMRQAMGDRG